MTDTAKLIAHAHAWFDENDQGTEALDFIHELCVSLEAAEAENRRLREALKQIESVEIRTGYDYVRTIARAALAGSGDE